MSRQFSPVHARAHNALLALFRDELATGAKIPAQAALARKCGASQTTIHHVLRSLREKELLGEERKGLRLLRPPLKKDFLPAPRSISRRDEVESGIIQMLHDGRLKPGQRFSELALARMHGVTTGTIRETLLRLSGLGVFTKQARRQWEVVKMDETMLDELMDLRLLLESFALKRYFRLKKGNREPFLDLLAETKAMNRGKLPDYNAFFALDHRLHRGILEAGHNRYLANHFQFIFFPIQIQFFHRDFRRDRIRLGLRQHLDLLELIVAGKEKEALACLEDHLASAREALSGANAAILG